MQLKLQYWNIGIWKYIGGLKQKDYSNWMIVFCGVGNKTVVAVNHSQVLVSFNGFLCSLQDTGGFPNREVVSKLRVENIGRWGSCL